MAAGDRGLIADPARRDAFRANVPVALGLAEAMGCRMLNALAGHALDGLDREAQLELARDNVRFAADAAAAQGADVLIEAVNTFENGPYLLASTGAASAFARSTGRDNVRLQYDAYHMARMEGDLAATIERHLGEIAHVQIADSPGRGQPGTGEIDFDHRLPPPRRAGVPRPRRPRVPGARGRHRGEPRVAAARGSRPPTRAEAGRSRACPTRSDSSASASWGRPMARNLLDGGLRGRRPQPQPGPGGGARGGRGRDGRRVRARSASARRRDHDAARLARRRGRRARRRRACWRAPPRATC